MSTAEPPHNDNTRVVRQGFWTFQTVEIVRCFGDAVVPGLGVAISMAVQLMEEICKRLLRRQRQAIRSVEERLQGILVCIANMEARNCFITVAWSEKYQDLFRRFHAFLSDCERKNVFVRRINGTKEIQQVTEFSNEIEALESEMKFVQADQCSIM